MKTEIIYEIDKKQLDIITGGDESQAERIAELEKELAEFMNTKQGQGLDLPERLPNGSYLGTGLGGGLGFHPSTDPNALQ
jgi:hypothetical protein